MTITQRAIKGAAVLDLKGDLTYSNRTAFKTAVEQVRNAGYRHLIVNLEQVRFMDSSGLGLLVLLSQTFRVQRARVSLLKPQSYVREIMSLANISKVIPIYETEGDALAAGAA